MADIAVTSAHVSLPEPTKAEITNRVAGEAIAAGQAVYINPSNGRVYLAYVDADKEDDNALQFRGIALNGAAAGQAVAVLHCGLVSGFDLDGLDIGDMLYLSETAGALADAASANATVLVGIVDAITTGYSTQTKVARIATSWLVTWEFASGG